MGISYEFNDFIQAIHRIYRFLQTERVIIDLIYTEAESAIYLVLMEKWKQHEYLLEKMQGILKQYGIGGVPAEQAMLRSIGVDSVIQRGTNWTAIHGDCVVRPPKMEEKQPGYDLDVYPVLQSLRVHTQL